MLPISLKHLGIRPIGNCFGGTIDYVPYINFGLCVISKSQDALFLICGSVGLIWVMMKSLESSRHTSIPASLYVYAFNDS